MKSGRLKNMLSDKHDFGAMLRRVHCKINKRYKRLFWDKARRRRAKLHMIKQRLDIPTEMYYLP